MLIRIPQQSPLSHVPPQRLSNALIAWPLVTTQLVSTHVGPGIWLIPSVPALASWFSWAIVVFSLSTGSVASTSFSALSTLSFSSSLLRHSSSIVACVLSSSVPYLGTNWRSLRELNLPALGKPSSVSRWYEFWFLLTTLHGAENFGKSFLSVETVKSKSL